MQVAATSVQSAAALALVHLAEVMERTSGSPGVSIGLIDGPVNLDHPALAQSQIRSISGNANCERPQSCACSHGTFVAGILSARRGSSGPAIAPGCTLLVRPIFPEGIGNSDDIPSTTPEELAGAIFDIVYAGARVINLSAGLTQPTVEGDRRLGEALNYATQKRVLVVAAAGNDRMVGSSAITRHPWVIPVVSCDMYGLPAASSNLGRFIGSRGISAPGEGIAGLAGDQGSEIFSGTSVAAPFVTGAIALLLSEFPGAPANAVHRAISGATRPYRSGIVPPLLDAWAAYQSLRSTANPRYIS
jgi:subtilisin family serine protease